MRWTGSGRCQRGLRGRRGKRLRPWMCREDGVGSRKGMAGRGAAFWRLSRVLVHRRMRLHHGHKGAWRIAHELILRRSEHRLVVRVQAGMWRRIRVLRGRVVHHAHGWLCGHRVLPDICSALAIGVLWRMTLEGRRGSRGCGPIFVRRRGGGGRVVGGGWRLEGRTRGRATRLAKVRHTSAARRLSAVGCRAGGARI